MCDVVRSVIMKKYESRLDQQDRAVRIITILQNATKNMVKPASVAIVNQFGRDPFLVLIGCLLSLRTRDTVSLPASLRLFQLATTPEALLKIPPPTISLIIYPVGFYRRKAQIIHDVCTTLIARFDGKVPHTLKELRSIKGIGPKTANLVLGDGFGIPAICVDTHVHRISNRLGLVHSTTPKETEHQLKELLPAQYWIEFNHLLVMWGQNTCMPISPFCSTCAIAPLCPRIGVKQHR
jgi:endonuclease III